MERKLVAKGIASAIVSALFLVLFSTPFGTMPPIGDLANPGGGIWTAADQAVTPPHLELSFPELEGTATVLRDPHGIPHIYADAEHDLFFAQGFVHAQDRLWQMDFMRRVAKGELSSIFGARAGSFDVLEVDTFVRTIGLPRIARAMVQSQDASDPSWGAIAAYAEGVNAYLRYAGGRLPLEFHLLAYRPEPWTSLDVVAQAPLLAWSLSGTFEDAELALLADGLGLDAVNELFPIEGPYQVPVDPRPGTRSADGFLDEGMREAARTLLARERALRSLIGGPFVGSNNWAVHGNRTDTALPRLANDPHLAFQLPAIWYENHLVGAGFDVYGVTFPGVPTVVLGQNRHIAWGATNVGADVVDLYDEVVDGDRYQYRGTWRDLEVREEVIPVRGGEPVTITVRETIHGPLVTEQGATFAMRWTGEELAAPRSILAAFYGLDRAESWTEFRDALRDFTVPAQNFVYADTAGNIGMLSNGLYPIRWRTDGRFPLDGASGDYEWYGFVPFDEYPESFNPVEDYVLSANQQPQPSGYRHYLGWSWDPGYRARRIAEMLAADDDVTAADMERMQLDTVDVMAREITPFILQSVFGTCATRECNEGLGLLANWDFRMDVDRPEPAIWWRFANRLRQEIFEDEWEAAGVSDLSLPMPHVVEYILKEDPTARWFDDVGTVGVETWANIVRRAFNDAVDGLSEELYPAATVAWRWGDIHHRQFDHLTALGPMSRGPFPSAGDALTVNVAAGDLARGGPSWRLLADLSDPAKSIGIYPGGQSGNPLSAHYADLLDLWLAGDYHPLRVAAAQLPTRDLESTLILRSG